MEFKRKIAALLLALLCLFVSSACGPVSETAPDSGNMEVHFIDVGQADSALLLCGGESLLIDGGNSGDSSLLYSYLRDHGVKRLDYIIATHPHEDHVGGITGALSYVSSVGEAFSPVAGDENYYFNRMVRRLEEMGVGLTVPEVGDSFEVGGARVTFLGPLELYDDMNQNSLVCRVDYGEISFLFTGDAERPAEELMLDGGAELGATVLKVGHHGSSRSTTYRFLREVAPAYAVISCEKNNSYGHPDDKLLSRLRDADVTVCRTDRNGHIVFTTDGAALSVAVQKGSVGTGSTILQEAPAEGEPMYVGNVSSKKYHRTTCSYLPSEKNSVYFYSLEEALGSGFDPCGMCKPDAAEVTE